MLLIPITTHQTAQKLPFCIKMPSMSQHNGVDWMSTTIVFDQGDKVAMVCMCGSMEGKVESMQWGVRILFECRDCNTSCAMEVTQ